LGAGWGSEEPCYIAMAPQVPDRVNPQCPGEEGEGTEVNIPRMPSRASFCPMSQALRWWGPPGWSRHITELPGVVLLMLTSSQRPHFGPQRVSFHKAIPKSSLKGWGRTPLKMLPRSHYHMGYSHPTAGDTDQLLLANRSGN
jgi:hypothetical protein